MSPEVLVRWLTGVLLASGAGFFGPAGCGSAPPPATTPVVPPAPPPLVAEVAVTEAGRDGPWPLRTFSSLAPAEATLSPGGVVLDLDAEPWTGEVLVVERDPRGGHHLWRWDLRSEPSLVETWVNRDVREVAWSPFGDVVYALSVGATAAPADPAGSAGPATTPAGHPLPKGLSPAPRQDWRLHRCQLAGDRLACDLELFATNAPLSALVPAPGLWDGAERVYVARAWARDHWQVLSTRADGSDRRELTSPDGEASPLTEGAFAPGAGGAFAPGAGGAFAPGTGDAAAPAPRRELSARPQSLHPVYGSLLVETTRGVRRWEYDGAWSGDAPVSGTGFVHRWHPNGWYRTEFAVGQDGVRVVEPDGTTLALFPDRRFVASPEVGGDGGHLLVVEAGADRPVLRVVPLEAPLARVRHLACAGSPARRPAYGVEERRQLATRGLVLADTSADRPAPLLVPGPDGDPACRPPLVTIDAAVEVLHAGHLRVEAAVLKDRALPAFRTFTAALSTSAQRAGLVRVAEIAGVTLQVLDGRTEHPEARRVLAGRRARSELHATEADFGPPPELALHAADPALQRYGRAVGYLDLLVLDAAARDTLRRDEALRAAWIAWREAPGVLRRTSRHPGLLDDAPAAPSWLDPACVGGHAGTPRLLPPAWGLDDEILARLASDAPPGCGAAGGPPARGAAILAALGGAGATARLGPAAAGALERLGQRVGARVADGDVPGAWLRLVQLLNAPAPAPGAVDPSAWEERRRSTALATWAASRQGPGAPTPWTTAGLPEAPPVPAPFAAEPVAPLVDPQPEAWDGVARLAALLGGASESTTLPDAVPEALQELAASARRFGDMARRQGRGQPLDAGAYAELRAAGVTLASLQRILQEDAAALERDVERDVGPPLPSASTRSVGLPSERPTWFAATGQPRGMLLLGSDRGVLVPAVGPVATYLELDAAPERAAQTSAAYAASDKP